MSENSFREREACDVTKRLQIPDAGNAEHGVFPLVSGLYVANGGLPLTIFPSDQKAGG